MNVKNIDLEKSQSPTRRSPRLISANTFIGSDVCNLEEENIGCIKQVMLNLSTGDINYVVLSFGESLGLDEKLFAVPWSSLQFDPEKKRFLLNVSIQLLKTAPGMNRRSLPSFGDPTFIRDTHSLYKKRCSM